MKLGKHSNSDFNESLLPKTRREQFKDLFKNEWKTLFGIGFWLFLFALPYIGFYSFRYVASSFYMSALTDAGVEESTINFNFVIFRLIFDAGNIIFYIIFALGLAGASRIFSNLIYGEGVLFKDDFILGIKKNSKTYIFAAIAFGLLKLLFRFSTGLLSVSGSALYSLIYGVFIIVLYLFIVPTIFYMVNINIRYNITFINNFKASSTYSLVSIIPCGIFTILLFFVLYIPLIAQLFIIILLFCIITIVIVPIYILLWKLYNAYIFDKYINESTYPEFYKKGLSK